MPIAKNTKISSDFRRITVSLASPEAILNRSNGEVLKPETINYRRISLRKMVSSASGFLDLLKITNVIVVSISAFVFKELFATDVELK